jgi:hypothetical protein
MGCQKQSQCGEFVTHENMETEQGETIFYLKIFYGLKKILNVKNYFKIKII